MHLPQTLIELALSRLHLENLPAFEVSLGFVQATLDHLQVLLQTPNVRLSIICGLVVIVKEGSTTLIEIIKVLRRRVLDIRVIEGSLLCASVTSTVIIRTISFKDRLLLS